MAGNAGSHPISDDTFVSPEVFVDLNEPEDKPYGKTLLPLVNTMWQLAGRESTPYMRDENWDPFYRDYR